MHNNNRPFVSVAIAIYNGDRFLREQLDSILHQTYSNFEVVISDDGSTDDTQKILNEYAEKDKRVRWYLSTRERGVLPNFTEAISLCKGEIIFLSDCDDVWYPNKIEKHVDAYKDKKIKWVYNKVVVTDEENNPTGLLEDAIVSSYYEKSRRNILYYTWGSCILGCATSYRASVLKNIWPAPAYSHGHDSWIQLAIWPATPFFIDEYLQDYRQHTNNTTGLRKLGTEEMAIKHNLLFLKSLVMSDRIEVWKRVFFLLVILGKLVRSVFRKVWI